MYASQPAHRTISRSLPSVGRAGFADRLPERVLAERPRFALLVPGTGQPLVLPVPTDAPLVLGRQTLPPADSDGVQLQHATLRHLPGGLEVVPRDGPVFVGGLELGPRGGLVQAGQVLRLGRRPVVVVAQTDDATIRLGALSSASPRVWQTYAELALAADADLPVLLGGESGTGKELAARAVHAASGRAAGPWQAVNCAALHGDTLLAELFGAAKGAYTGAMHDRQGAFERAHGGTLFLDEVGELSPHAQAALLRALEVGEIQVLGGQTKRVDVRIVAATHRDLQRDVASGRFRLDLYYRLAVLEVRMPALRDRPEDLQPLLQHFLGVVPAPKGAAQLLRAHPPAGNLRGLRNLALRLAVMSPTGQPRLDDLRALLLGTHGPRAAEPTPIAPRNPVDRLEAVAHLMANAATVSDAWRASGLPRGTFFRYWKRLRAELETTGGVPTLVAA